jgi:hypothetical protein
MPLLHLFRIFCVSNASIIPIIFICASFLLSLLLGVKKWKFPVSMSDAEVSKCDLYAFSQYTVHNDHRGIL